MRTAQPTSSPQWRRAGRRAAAPSYTVFATFVFIIIIMVATPQAQTLVTHSGAAASWDATGQQQIQLLVGRSAVLNMDTPIQRVSLTTPDIADALITSPRQVLIHGKTPGTISLFVWGSTGGIKTYAVVVRRDLSALRERVEQLFPGEPITIASNGTDVVISGTVSSKYVVEKAAAVTAGFVETKDNVVNLLRQQEGVASNQVMLRVRFAEVSRSALQELGASFFTGIGGYEDYVARTTTQQFAAPVFDDERGLVFSDFLNLFAFNTREQLGTVIKALQTRGLFQSLAEPNLITQSGTEASFLAGGEFPFPVVQGAGGLNTALTIQFKEFGVRLNFVPTLLGEDRVHLRVRPEVSALDFSNAVTVEGFRVPALTTRRTETEVELRDGQTFAIAGLVDNTVTETMSKIPGIGDIPILGYLFRSKAHQKNHTELVVMITPHILRRDSTGVVPGLPNMVYPFLEPPRDTYPPPPPSMPQAEAGPVGAQAPVAAAGARALSAPTSGASAAVAASQPLGTAAPRELTKEEKKALEREREELKKRRVAEAKRAAEAEKAARRKAEEDRKQADKLAREQAKRDAKAAKRAAEAERRRLEAERKQAEKARKQAEKLAREQAKRDAEAAKRAAEAERRRLEAERKQAEKEGKQAEKLAREQAKRDAKVAKRMAQAEKKLREAERERAKAEAELEALRSRIVIPLDWQRAPDERDPTESQPPPE